MTARNPARSSWFSRTPRPATSLSAVTGLSRRRATTVSALRTSVCRRALARRTDGAEKQCDGALGEMTDGVERGLRPRTDLGLGGGDRHGVDAGCQQRHVLPFCGRPKSAIGSALLPLRPTPEAPHDDPVDTVHDTR